MLKRFFLLLALLLTSCSPFTDLLNPGLPATLPPTVVVAPTSTPEPTPTPAPPTPEPPVPFQNAGTTIYLPAVIRPKPYIVQTGTPVMMQNFAHTVEGCNWLSVAGQVFNKSGKPVLELAILVSGTLNGAPVDLVGFTGTAPEYGPGGYEILLATQAVDSTGTLFVQVYDLYAKELSERVYFNTSASCSKNVVLVNFTE